MTSFPPVLYRAARHERMVSTAGNSPAKRERHGLSGNHPEGPPGPPRGGRRGLPAVQGPLPHGNSRSAVEGTARSRRRRPGAARLRFDESRRTCPTCCSGSASTRSTSPYSLRPSTGARSARHRVPGGALLRPAARHRARGGRGDPEEPRRGHLRHGPRSMWPRAQDSRAVRVGTRFAQGIRGRGAGLPRDAGVGRPRPRVRDPSPVATGGKDARPSHHARSREPRDDHVPSRTASTSAGSSSRCCCNGSACAARSPSRAVRRPAMTTAHSSRSLFCCSAASGPIRGGGMEADVATKRKSAQETASSRQPGKRERALTTTEMKTPGEPGAFTARWSGKRDLNPLVHRGATVRRRTPFLVTLRCASGFPRFPC